jgi:predicted component of type VI protein secretion system
MSSSEDHIRRVLRRRMRHATEAEREQLERVDPAELAQRFERWRTGRESSVSTNDQTIAF